MNRAVEALTPAAWTAGTRARKPLVAPDVQVPPLGTAAVAVGITAGVLAASGLWIAVALLVVAVAVVEVLHRAPLAGVAAWLALTPLVVITETAAVRMVFWGVHRLLPVLILVVLWARPLVMDRPPRLHPLRKIDLVVLAYPVATLVSIAYTAEQPVATAVHLYDRTVVPILLYLLLRLLRPDRAELERWLVPAVAAVLAGQIAVGLVSWAAPDLLPREWTDLARLRTTGTLRAVSVYGVTVILGVMVMLDQLATAASRARRAGALVLVTLGTLMVFLTFSRGSWLAGLLAIGGGLLLHRRLVPRVAAGLVVAAVLVGGTGAMAGQLDFARERLVSDQAEESALSRLPVVLASVRMFQERPLEGFGYDSFDRFDRAYQGPVAGFYPDKDHASHNVYLTLLAEQGMLGLLLYLAPAAYWLWATRRVRRRRALDPPGSRLVGLLWLSLAGHVIVNQFSNMQVSFGLALWWVTLALIANAVSSPSSGTSGSTEAAQRRPGRWDDGRSAG